MIEFKNVSKKYGTGTEAVKNANIRLKEIEDAAKQENKTWEELAKEDAWKGKINFITDYNDVYEEYKNNIEEANNSLMELLLLEQDWGEIDQQNYEKNRKSFIEAAKKEGIDAKEAEKFLRNSSYGHLERLFQNKKQLKEPFKDLEGINEEIEKIAKNGKLTYAMDILKNEDLKNNIKNVEQLNEEVEKLYQSGVQATYKSFRSQAATIISELSENGNLDEIDSESLQEFYDILGSLPGLYNESTNALAEFNELLEQDAGVFEKISYLLKTERLGDSTNFLDEMASWQESLGLGGNVDLNNRPTISSEAMQSAGWNVENGSISTVLTNTGTNTDETIAINFTPILQQPDGSTDILSPESLQNYMEEVCQKVENGESLQTADYLHIAIGSAFIGEDAIAQAEQAAQTIHVLQDAIYNGSEEAIAQLEAAYFFNINQDIEQIKNHAKETLTYLDNYTQLINSYNNAIANINTDFTIDGDQVNTVLDQLPELARAVESYTSNGIQLNRELAQEILNTAQTEIDAQGKVASAKFGSDMAELQRNYDMLQLKKEMLANEVSSEAAANKLLEGLDEDTQKAYIYGLFGVVSAAEEASIEEQNSQIDVENQSAITGAAIQDNITQGAVNAASNVQQATQSMIDNFAQVAVASKQALNGQQVTAKTANGVSVTYSGKTEKKEHIEGKENSEALKKAEAAFEKFKSGNKGWSKGADWDSGTSAALAAIENNQNLITGTMAKYIKGQNALNQTLQKSGIGANKTDSSGSGSTSTWKNDYDWLYNLEQHITEEKRKQAQLEADLKDLEEDPNASGAAKLKNLREQLKVLEQQRQLRELEVKKRQEEMDAILAANSSLSQYATYNKDHQAVQIDWNAIEAIQDEELYKQVQDYVKELERIEGELDDTKDELEDIDDQVREIRETYHDDYVDFENRVLDAIVELREREIDAIENVNNAIDNANNRLIESMNDSLEQQRQDRQNEEKRQEIADMQQKLAYLSLDTSGANQVEILQLQQQLDDARQSYTDQLIDQKISELQKQNDEASEERQAQIELMQAQLEFEKESGLLWTDVYSLINQGITANGVLIDGSELTSTLKSAENWSGLSEVQKNDWVKDLKTDTSSVWAYLNARDLNTSELTGIQQQTAIIAKEIGAQQIANSKITPSNSGDPNANNPNSGSIINPNYGIPLNAPKENWADEHIGKTYYLMPGSRQVWDSNKKAITLSNKNPAEIKIASGYINKDGVKSLYGQSQTNGKYYYFKSKQLQVAKNGNAPWAFETGGLADYTGPAWLDGTKARPEYVLNAAQTQGFLHLVDLLDHTNSNPYITTNKTTNSQITNNITIEAQISNDYDVERLASRLKKELYDDGMYRNVNQINRLR